MIRPVLRLSVALLAALAVTAHAATAPAQPSSAGARDGAMPAPAPTGQYALKS
jgi:hypothetical protein